MAATADTTVTPGADNQSRTREGAGDGHLACKACGRRICSDDDRVVMHGSHVHVFFNPHGLVFELGCFAMAAGVSMTGEPTSEFTWFPGYAWQPALCPACQSHLGWRYLSEQSGRGFFGLILAALVRRSDS